MIGMSGYRAEAAAAAAAAHVAQQSRRNKLRVQPGGAGGQMMQVRDVFDPAMFSSSAMMEFGNPASAAAAAEFQYQDAVGVAGIDGSLIGTQYQEAQSLQFSTAYCQNGLQEVVSSSTTNQGLAMAAWGGGNELLLLPSPRIDNTGSVWMGREHQQWNGEGEFSATQGLSLSLASNPASVQQFEGLQSSQGGNEVGVMGSYAKFMASNRGYTHCEGFHGAAGLSVDVRRAVGPLGPFTGYATILKSSKFLKPAQQLLIEFCNAVIGPNGGRDAATVAEKEGCVRGGDSGACLSSFYGSTEITGDGGSGSGHRPEFQQKKAKLLVMQEEVCRRYKQYHQQMQMVVSAFESVAGLSTATPYTSLALKSVSKHFRCIKNAISDQIRHMSKMLGEELMSSPSSSKADNHISRSKFIDQGLRKSTDTGFTDHSPPVWRPQRGLPERSVAVLRAWLFEHFLHPYPTDTDKHMLATQTGLSRNQVSNWFINARVRLWKPMVEEIHMLETKGIAEMNLNAGNKNEGKMVMNNDQQGSEAQSSKPGSDCSSMVSAQNNESYRNLEQWHREKRSRMEECIVPGGIDGGLMSFYHGGMEMGGLGAVSLTLGLRHSDGAAGSAQQAPPPQQQMTRHFGSQLVHDFVA
ncbi:putative transcription factor Homeodomain-TALE-BEL family [Dioscorea sansibarensis]